MYLSLNLIAVWNLIQDEYWGWLLWANTYTYTNMNTHTQSVCCQFDCNCNVYICKCSIDVPTCYLFFMNIMVTLISHWAKRFEMHVYIYRYHFWYFHNNIHEIKWKMMDFFWLKPIQIQLKFESLNNVLLEGQTSLGRQNK